MNPETVQKSCALFELEQIVAQKWQGALRMYLYEIIAKAHNELLEQK